MAERLQHIYVSLIRSPSSKLIIVPCWRLQAERLHTTFIQVLALFHRAQRIAGIRACRATCHSSSPYHQCAPRPHPDWCTPVMSGVLARTYSEQYCQRTRTNPTSLCKHRCDDRAKSTGTLRTRLSHSSSATLQFLICSYQCTSSYIFPKPIKTTSYRRMTFWLKFYRYVALD